MHATEINHSLLTLMESVSKHIMHINSAERNSSTINDKRDAYIKQNFIYMRRNYRYIQQRKSSTH